MDVAYIGPRRERCSVVARPEARVGIAGRIPDGGPRLRTTGGIMKDKGGTASRHATSSSPMLIGRETELGALMAGLEEALSGRGLVCTLVGEAGMGKTSMAQWLSERAQERAAAVAWGRCWEAVDAPAFWPWAQLVRQLVTDLGSPAGDENFEPWRLVSYPEAAIPARQDGGRLAEFDSLTRFLKQMADRTPLVLILEDLHAADDSSLLMLQYLGREIRDSRILVAATYDESGAGRRTVAARILGEIGREGRQVSLDGLDEEAVAQLYRRIAGEQPPGAVAQAVFRASEGNPLFVGEATKMLTSKGNIFRPDYSIGFRVPHGVRDMIRGRLEHVSTEAAAVLSAASVLGRDFDVGVLSRLCDLDVDTVLDLVGDGVHNDVVEEAGALGRYRFSHILIRETLYEDLTAAKRMRLHRRAAEVLEEMYAGDVETRLPELAHHWFKAAQAGDSQKTLEYATRAAEQAASHLAFEEAVRLYQRALKASDLAGAGASRRKELERALGEMQGKAASGTVEPSSPPGSDDRFQREGEFWTIAYHGSVCRLKDSKGLRFLAHLLRNPGAEIHVLDLVAQVEGGSAGPRRADRSVPVGSEGLGDAGDVLDPAAKAAYKKRLEDLEEEIEEAHQFNDVERASRFQEEKDALIQQLAGAVGLGGRDRKAASVAERARVSVTKTIKEALRKVSENDPELANHLNLAVKTGTYCSYTPDPRARIQWKL